MYNNYDNYNRLGLDVITNAISFTYKQHNSEVAIDHDYHLSDAAMQQLDAMDDDFVDKLNAKYESDAHRSDGNDC